MESLPAAVLPGTRKRLLVDLDRVALEVETVPPRLANGDLAPVNLLVRDGRVAAVLDLDRARLAHPLYDAAWFAWVVWFHDADFAEAAVWTRRLRSADEAVASLLASAFRVRCIPNAGHCGVPQLRKRPSLGGLRGARFNGMAWRAGCCSSPGQHGQPEFNGAELISQPSIAIGTDAANARTGHSWSGRPGLSRSAEPRCDLIPLPA